MASLFQLPRAVPVSAGNGYASARARFYQAGTTTDITTYTTSALSVAHANPVVADANGVFPAIYINEAVNTSYRLQIRTSADVLVYDEDNIPSLPSQANIGAALWPRTAAEITASVTPTNYAYEPGDVRRYGAVGDGATDDTTALNNAFASNDLVYLPGGRNYRITQKINITNAGLRVYGDGFSSIISASANSFDLIEVRANNVSFDGLAFYGAASAGTTTQYGLFTATAFAPLYLNVKRCYFGGSSSSSRLNNGVKFDDACNYGTVTECVFDEPQGNASGAGYGVLVGDAVGVKITNCTALAAATRGRHAFYLSAGASHCHVIGNYSSAFNEEHITINSLNTQDACAYNVISKNVLAGGAPNSSTGAISLWGRTTGNLVEGNILVAPGEMGIIVQALNGAVNCDSLDNAVIGNIILNAGTRGIELSGSTRTVVRDNVVYESSQDAAGTHPNIRLVATGGGGQAVTDCVVSDNVSRGTSFARSALQLNSTSPAPSGTILRGNHFPTCNLAAIELNGVDVNANEYNASFTGTLTGCTTSPTASVAYSLRGDIVTIELLALTATSNTTACTITGMPTLIRPAAAQTLIGICTDNGTNAISRIIVETSGTLTLHNGLSATFTNSGTKGVQNCSLTYRIR